ncbi:hypothetical protein [Halalkalibacter sp. APA_J-10(15)]|uniref:hypothetical protein n=1 Tax=Halalkalibacter sp. APA_J-10(15) TaxID=2933805 RepID=UPI001FF6BA71|nr:hypothetical protein [Halalkalibacter sp. APA_J-10(15)]MCK0471416.1 hypothetical protein [Halalkalibacter sp. APA_J-10(15)]
MSLFKMGKLAKSSRKTASRISSGVNHAKAMKDGEGAQKVAGTLLKYSGKKTLSKFWK